MRAFATAPPVASFTVPDRSAAAAVGTLDTHNKINAWQRVANGNRMRRILLDQSQPPARCCRTAMEKDPYWRTSTLDNERHPRHPKGH